MHFCCGIHSLVSDRPEKPFGDFNKLSVRADSMQTEVSPEILQMPRNAALWTVLPLPPDAATEEVRELQGQFEFSGVARVQHLCRPPPRLRGRRRRRTRRRRKRRTLLLCLRSGSANAEALASDVGTPAHLLRRMLTATTWTSQLCWAI